MRHNVIVFYSSFLHKYKKNGQEVIVILRNKFEGRRGMMNKTELDYAAMGFLFGKFGFGCIEVFLKIPFLEEQ